MTCSGFKWAQSFENAAHRLVPHVVDELARDDPERILYELAIENDTTKPFEKISARQYANAINRVATWLENTLGKRIGFPTVGYIGPQDLRYLILVVATIKAGYKILFISNRNSIEGDIAVIEASDCKLWLVPSHGSNIQRLLPKLSLSTYDLPDLGWALDPQPVLHYPYNKTWETGNRDPLWIVHTSGSTGTPKPVFRYLDSAAASGANTIMSKINGRPLLLHDYFDSRAYLTFPFFHAAGLANGLLWPLFYGTTIILGPQKPVELGLMKDVIRHAKPDTIFTAPSIVEDIAKDDEFLALLETVKAIGYGGGPVSKQGGDRIWKHTKLRLSIGVSEAGNIPCVETDPEDWNYLHFHPNNGFELQDRGSGLYELVAVRKPELEPWQPIFSTFPDLQVYPTKDLFSKHPNKPNLYTYEGRADNVLVLSNGEKVQPHTMELMIAAHPLVDCAVVAGQARFQVSLLVELNRNHPSATLGTKAVVELLWPSVEQANKSAPTHARILKDFIMIASLDKPFSKTDKGTVRRGPTLQLYREELDRLYFAVENAIDNDQNQLDISSFHEFQIGLKKLIKSITNRVDPGDNEDLFAAGIDSLQVISLVRELQKAIPLENGKKPIIKPAFIYRNPTIHLLAKELFDIMGSPHSSGTNGHPDTANGRLVTSEDILKYASGLDRNNRTEKRAAVVILTGSTGSLGSYLLDELMNSETVEEIWCLNRSIDAEARQKAGNAAKGLRVDFRERGVFFRQALLAQRNLGLPDEDYTVLQNKATHIIHTQWQVNFNLHLASFELHIRGTRNLIEFGLDALRRARRISLFFTSSVGVANQARATTPIPEAKIKDYNIAGSGYGESKLVAEALLLQASENLGLDVAISRIGQIAGPVGKHKKKGLWSRKEWLPSIVDASANLRLLPRTLGRNEGVDWIPVDIVASAIVELALKSDEETTRAHIFHLVNPHSVRWEHSVLPIIQARLEAATNGGNIEVVSLYKWVEGLRNASSESVTRKIYAELSASKLIDFFAGLNEGEMAERPEFETHKTRAVSEKLQNLTPVSVEWIHTWLDQWGY